MGDWYSLCRVRDYWKTEVTNDDLASAIPDDYMDYDIIHLRGDGNAGNSPIDEAKLDNFLSAGKGIYVISAACEDGMFACKDDNWFPFSGYGGSAGNRHIVNENHLITSGYSGDYGTGSGTCSSAGYNNIKTYATSYTKFLAREFINPPTVDCGENTYTMGVAEYKSGRIVWDAGCTVDEAMYHRAIEWLSPWQLKN